MLDTGLKQLKENLDLFGYKNVNLLSCMTLNIEHLHSTVNYKHGMQTMLQYARSFTSSIKECVKSLTRWSAYYFTSTESWYPLPSGSLKLSELSFPKPILPSNLPAAERIIMREWASVNGAVRSSSKKCSSRNDCGKGWHSSGTCLSTGACATRNGVLQSERRKR